MSLKAILVLKGIFIFRASLRAMNACKGCVNAVECRDMNKTTKRTRITRKKESSTDLTIREHHEIKNGKGYSSFIVQGWKEDGKWKRKKFKLEEDAKRFVNLKGVELENQGRSQRMVLSPLTDEQTQEAVEAFDSLGETYSLKDAVKFYLENHRKPGFEISLKDGLKIFLAKREREGVRARSLKQSESVLRMFIAAVGDCPVHEVTPQKVNAFLEGLRAKDGVSNAKRKTWNNYRNELGLFFKWCAIADLGTQRPWTFTNPMEGVIYYKAEQVADERDEIATTETADVQRIFSVLMRWRGGIMVKPFALAYFAGIRPDGELKRLAPLEAEQINLKTGFITIPAKVSKTKFKRQVKITKNLAAWLEAYSDFPIIPPNWDRFAKLIRTHFKLSHDEARHSFISYHVAVHRSLGDVALQAGNSESIVKKHYLHLHTEEDGASFFGISPGGNRQAIIAKGESEAIPHLKVV